MFDVVADVIDPIASIALDNEAAELFKRTELPEGMTAWEFFIHRVKDNLPPLLKRHKSELATIMATIEGVSVKEYMDSVTLPKLFHDLTELLTDDEFTAFFG